MKTAQRDKNTEYRESHTRERWHPCACGYTDTLECDPARRAQMYTDEGIVSAANMEMEMISLAFSFHSRFVFTIHWTE